VLSDEDRQRLRAEEIFRSEVRRDLEANAPKPLFAKRIWSVINSAFFLWCLSSVVVAGLTAAVATHQKSRDEQTRNAEQRKRITIEISNRVSEAIEAMDVDRARIAMHQSFHASWIYNEVVSYLDNFFRTDPSNPRDFSTYPEYRARTFRSLISELRTFQDPTALGASKQALDVFGQLIIPSSLGDEADSKAADAGEDTNAVNRCGDILARIQNAVVRF
jgi:hypothetical protein